MPSFAVLILPGAFSALLASRHKERDSTQRRRKEELALHRTSGSRLAQRGHLLGNRELPAARH